MEIVKAKKKAAKDETKITEEELKGAVTRITLHGLRHSINTALLEHGVNPELLRASFGWVDKDTQEIYTHRELYNLSPQRDAVDKLFDGFMGEETVLMVQKQKEEQKPNILIFKAS